jgi:hypothetical protein
MANQQTLSYRVPDGQDPVVVTAALSAAGYRVEVEHGGAVAKLRIECPAGPREREQIREVIASDADKTSLDGPQVAQRVTFDDEV